MADLDDDRDDPQPEDVDDLDREGGADEEPALTRCPACGRSVYADTPRCPGCGEWLPDDTPAERRSRGWLWPVLIAGLIAAILAVWHGIRP